MNPTSTRHRLRSLLAPARAGIRFDYLARVLHRPDRLGSGLLAGHAALRHADLQRGGHALPGYGGFVGRFSGILLWPAVIAHAILSAFLLRALISNKKTG